MIILRNYQVAAIKELREETNKLLKYEASKTIVFKAPTGSGKTIMMAEFIKELVEHRDDTLELAFIWTAPRQLHTQSKEKLENYYADSKALRSLSFEDLSDNQIYGNEILFFNWESINKRDNVYIRDNEEDRNLTHVIDNTKGEGRVIILIVDESHHAKDTEISKDLIEMIGPKVTIDVSATPHLLGDKMVTVGREDVIDEEMIKKRIAVNPEFKNIIEGKIGDLLKFKSDAATSANEIVVAAAIAKREELQKALEAEGANVNPLMLIQLPDRRQGLEDIKDEIVEILKANHKITTDNGKLAIYLSEDKENRENITRHDCEVEVMIFKQAIALGWDCPRACILALFRELKSFTFSIQTLGRIMRMPELKHYKNDVLNTGFVYTNLSDIAIVEDIAGSYVTINQAKRKEIYQNIALRSVHSKRFREETRLAPRFIQDFLDAAKEQKLKVSLDTNVKDLKAKLISDGVITNPDKPFEHLTGEAAATHTGETVEIKRTEKEIQKVFDSFVRESLHPLAPERRSVGRVKEAIHRFFTDELSGFEYGGIDSQVVVLAEKNQQKFIDAINLAKDKYMESVSKGKKEIVVDENWEVPGEVNYGNEVTEKKANLSIMEPFFEKIGASGPEKRFVDFLEKNSDKILWWFKNGERDGTFFAVPYEKSEGTLPFYVDWIVMLKDGRIGLFDTKSGITAETAGPRAEGLAKYIKEENVKGKNLFGGIVVEKEGSWHYTDNESYSYDSALTGWKILSL